MKTNENPGLTKKKYIDRMRLFTLVILVVGAIIARSYIFAVTIIFVFYFLYELLWSDHIFYNPKTDYTYQFEECTRFQVTLSNDSFLLPDTDLNEKTLLLALRIKSGFLGKIFDPYVMVQFGDRKQTQYLERNVEGRRYLNISHLLDEGCDSGSARVKITTRHCHFTDAAAELIAFDNYLLDGRTILVIAPHADDAEIAAFGLYSRHESRIVTLTAGELEAENFSNLLYPELEQASLLKGRLRSIDTFSAGLWGGLKQECCVNLGYFCLTLEQMHESPNEPVSSKMAGIKDTRAFRNNNMLQLSSDKDGKATWRNLVSDLQECIDYFRPDVIVTPHPKLDPHKDHIYATKALSEALSRCSTTPEYFLMYANHLRTTDIFPFGQEHTVMSLPPQCESDIFFERVFSYELSDQMQRDKIYSLEMMHDLKPSLRFRKRLRKYLQKYFLGRSCFRYGQDDFFRKAIRSNELFYNYKNLE